MIWGASLDPDARIARFQVWRDALLSNDYAALSDARPSSSFISRLKQASETARISLAMLRADDALDMRFLNTDAEVVVVLENAEGELRILKRAGEATTGPIDNPEVRKSIQELLEGGVRAFVNRERRYDNELSKYRTDVGMLARRRSGASSGD